MDQQYDNNLILTDEDDECPGQDYVTPSYPVIETSDSRCFTAERNERIVLHPPVSLGLRTGSFFVQREGQEIMEDFSKKYGIQSGIQGSESLTLGEMDQRTRPFSVVPYMHGVGQLHGLGFLEEDAEDELVVEEFPEEKTHVLPVEPIGLEDVPEIKGSEPERVFLANNTVRLELQISRWQISYVKKAMEFDLGVLCAFVAPESALAKMRQFGLVARDDPNPKCHLILPDSDGRLLLFLYGDFGSNYVKQMDRINNKSLAWKIGYMQQIPTMKLSLGVHTKMSYADTVLLLELVLPHSNTWIIDTEQYPLGKNYEVSDWCLMSFPGCITLEGSTRESLMETVRTRIGTNPLLLVKGAGRELAVLSGIVTPFYLKGYEAIGLSDVDLILKKDWKPEKQKQHIAREGVLQVFKLLSYVLTPTWVLRRLGSVKRGLTRSYVKVMRRTFKPWEQVEKVLVTPMLRQNVGRVLRFPLEYSILFDLAYAQPYISQMSDAQDEYLIQPSSSIKVSDKETSRPPFLTFLKGMASAIFMEVMDTALDPMSFPQMDMYHFNLLMALVGRADVVFREGDSFIWKGCPCRRQCSGCVLDFEATVVKFVEKQSLKKHIIIEKKGQYWVSLNGVYRNEFVQWDNTRKPMIVGFGPSVGSSCDDPECKSCRSDDPFVHVREQPKLKKEARIPAIALSFEEKE